ncbi:MAG: dihydroneopterin aldolase [Gammaproteobacteria bacterium]|nr:dihydroneopterin aldolase [Gammaproteobacteria bacterium]
MPTLNDTIFVTDLRIEAVVGIWDWERALPQTISIDLEMAADIRAAAEADVIEATLDYRAVSKRVTAFVQESKFQLIETLVERVAGLIQQEFGVAWVRVSVHKPWAVRGSRDVGITIERGER